LCFLRASRRIDRCVVALRGREGWLGLLIKASKDVDDVVGNAKGYGIMSFVPTDFQIMRLCLDMAAVRSPCQSRRSRLPMFHGGKCVTSYSSYSTRYRGNRSATWYAARPWTNSYYNK
jgi:hypothetical protein